MIPAWHAIRAQQSIPHCRVELFEGSRALSSPRRAGPLRRNGGSSSRLPGRRSRRASRRLTAPAPSTAAGGVNRPTRLVPARAPGRTRVAHRVTSRGRATPRGGGPRRGSSRLRGRGKTRSRRGAGRRACRHVVEQRGEVLRRPGLADSPGNRATPRSTIHVWGCRQPQAQTHLDIRSHVPPPVVRERGSLLRASRRVVVQLYSNQMGAHDTVYRITAGVAGGGGRRGGEPGLVE